MDKTIYGVNIDSGVTPEKVVAAISKCFYEAHCSAIGLTSADTETGKDYCRMIVEKAFKDSGGDAEHPTKESILKAMEKLAGLSEFFRSKEEIKEHYEKIMILVEKL